MSLVKRTAASAALLFLFTVFSVSCATSSFTGTGCSINFSYSDSAAPGDAVYARMSLKSRARRKSSQETIAVLELFRNGKKIDSAQFFLASPKLHKQTSFDMIASLPLSLWLSSDDSYSLKVIYTAFGSDPEEFEIPFTLVKKEFQEDIVPLNEANTAIKTDTSQVRTDQIDKLNAILETAEPSDVYTLKPFVPPVPADTRRSSNFGDRRTYRYASGKTSSTAHYGIDYAVPEGTAVSACADGRVVMAESRITTGWSVVIEHAPGLYSLYYHMKSLNAKEGQYVHQGDKIGISGSTGLSTGPHLHWEIRLNMLAVSPDFFTKDYAFTAQE
jgi:murein DD-endopeptidase MepM/ murein hydrolase activator NlpD